MHVVLACSYRMAWVNKIYSVNRVVSVQYANSFV